jgi:hypothetical protein
LVEGETMADKLRRGPLPVEESLKLALQIAEALELDGGRWQVSTSGGNDPLWSPPKEASRRAYVKLHQIVSYALRANAVELEG